MVSFDRRLGSVRKGYSRQSVKRDTEIVLERELSGRATRDVIDDDRGIASLIFGPREDRLADGDLIATNLAEPKPERKPLVIEVEPIEIPEPAPPRRGRLRRWLRGLFGL